MGIIRYHGKAVRLNGLTDGLVVPTGKFKESGKDLRHPEFSATAKAPKSDASKIGRRHEEQISNPLNSIRGAFTIDACIIPDYGGVVLEKPIDENDACRMLRELSGQTHTVASAVAVTTLNEGTRSALDLCEVTFNELTDAFIQSYVASGSPMDKAGAYGVQDVMGLVGVTKLTGSFYTVMGMPTHRLHNLLLETV